MISAIALIWRGVTRWKFIVCDGIHSGYIEVTPADWDNIKDVNPEYIKETAGAFSEMSVGEKDAVDATILDSYKEDRRAAVKTRTQELLVFTYDSNNFSSSFLQRSVWNLIEARTTDYPDPILITKADDSEYSLTKANLAAFLSAFTSAYISVSDADRALIASINGAATKVALDAVVDSR
jgi:putative ribosome biogenesis GTPase RsgA